MGINPVHFAGGYGNEIYPLRNNACSDIWARYSWQQSDIVSHYELAVAIAAAEQELANVLGYHLAPRWISREMHKYPSFHRPELTTHYGRQYSDGLRKSVKSRWGKLIAGGRRGTTLVLAATTTNGGLTYLDLDSDGFFETARITATTTLTNDCELKVYIADTGADQRWEIKPARSITISSGTATLDFDSWLFFDPALMCAPDDLNGFTAISLDDLTNLVNSVDLYREYNDTSAVASRFFWQPTDCDVCSSCSITLESGGTIVLGGGSGDAASCTICGMLAQDGCVLIGDVETGIAVPAPANYDSTNEVYTLSQWAISRDPDIAQMWYYAGAIDEARLSGAQCDPLSHFWAETIAHMATARLERPMCSCANVTTLADGLREDIAFTGEDTSFLVDFGLLSNPFGTRRGEVKAWMRASKMGERILEGVSL
jgi:hypothetical protein